MPRLDAMSLASDGDSSRVLALSRAAAIAEVVVVFFGGVDSFCVVVLVATASSAVFLGSAAGVAVASMIASFS